MPGAGAVLSFYSCANAGCGGTLQRFAGGRTTAAKYRACAQCRVAYYCTVACQKADWKARHKASCLPGVKNNAQHARALAFLRQVAASRGLCDSLLAAADKARRDKKVRDVFLLATVRPEQVEIAIAAVSRAELARPALQYLRSEVKGVPPEAGVCVVAEALLERLPGNGNFWKKSLTPAVIRRAEGSVPRPACAVIRGAEGSVPRPASASRPLECERCSREDSEAAPLLSCSRCRLSMYCNTECQRAHWPVHKTWCQPQTQAALAAALALNVPKRHVALKRGGAPTPWLRGRLLLLETVLDLVRLDPVAGTLPPQAAERERVLFEICATKARVAAELLCQEQGRPERLQNELQGCVPPLLQPQILAFWAQRP